METYQALTFASVITALMLCTLLSMTLAFKMLNQKLLWALCGAWCAWQGLYYLGMYFIHN